MTLCIKDFEVSRHVTTFSSQRVHDNEHMMISVCHEILNDQVMQEYFIRSDFIRRNQSR